VCTYATCSVYRSIFLAQVQTCSSLAANYFQAHQALSAQDLRVLEASSPSSSLLEAVGRGGEGAAGGGKGVQQSHHQLLASLCPEEVESCIGPSYTHVYGGNDTSDTSDASDTPSAASSEKNNTQARGVRQLALEVEQEAEEARRGGVQGPGQEEGGYHPLNCILSTASRRQAVAVLYPHGLTLRRFQLLLDRYDHSLSLSMSMCTFVYMCVYVSI
jgi:hypothetical protein